MQKRTFVLAAAAAATLALGSTQAQAQAYPSKPIRIVVPFPASGTSDVLARLVGQKMSEKLGQSVVVENKAGNAGNIGADFVAKSPADGYTFVLMDVGNLTISPALYKLPFDVQKDFVPVAMVGYSPHLLVVSSKVPANTIGEFIQYAKANPGKLNFAAAAGMGSATHMAGVQFARRNGIQWNVVPYKGGAQAMTDLVGGHMDVTFNGMVATYPHVKAGKLKLLAVSSAKRWSELPDTPAVAETSPNFLTGSWQGLLAPAGTPKAVVDLVHAEVQRITALPDVKEKLQSLGLEPSKMSSAEFAAWIKAELPEMAQIVREEKITLQ
ncbi:tripartite tricarboxylate transporter substrate binding protein [Hydrogenophaga sp.]|uniref:Bug family tripartite tricarboxylate transporter substrate binding protein n=1 Tax=Hydrogenophaga sp. TaxID=1904254 RepID=UPI00286DC3AB|nr:tripartite tricarboxylate transporter substrate binding protein [Hydrogenophaga sp.]